MTFRVVSDSYLLSLNRACVWHKQEQRFVTILFSVPPCQVRIRPFSYRVRYRGCTWKQKTGIWRLCPCRTNFLRHNILQPFSYLCFSTSACLGSTDLSHHMSRLKSTLETVSKAISVTQTEVFSRIARLKPRARNEKTEREASSETPALQAQENRPALTSTVTPTPVPHAPSLPETSLVTRTTTDTASQSDESDKSDEPASDRTTASKHSAPLFHPSSFSVSLDETYSYLAHHVNSYFSSLTMAHEKRKEAEDSVNHATPFTPDQSHKNSDHTPTHGQVNDQTSSAISASLPAPSSTSSSKKAFGEYLAYTPAVQAFVGNYIAPLVPRLKAGPKNALAETENALPPTESKQKDTTENKEQKAADEKTRRLLLQREKIIARVSVDNRTRALVQALHRASDVKLYISRVEELSYHLLAFPETRLVAVKEKAIPRLLRLRQANDPLLMAAVRKALALVGHTDPVKGRGVRILSIDGGGTRGLVALQTLQKLEELSGKRIYQLFDYICGVSTGAILGFMLGMIHIPLNECEDLYRKLGSDVFKQNVIVGTVKMGWRHAFYDSEIWESVLKERMGSDLLIETSKNPDCPKVAAVSTVVNKGTPLKAYVFRNYNLPVGVRSHYRGGCKHKLWEAIRASSAAPGYFQEFALGTDLHQDGGLLINNPTALAIHECHCLWPNTPLQCVVSLGTGRFETPSKNSATYTSLKTKLTNVISSATDTEEVHTMLDALLPPHTYFRFNPCMSEEVALDESRTEKLNQLQAEGIRYLERNEKKMKRAVSRLMQEKSSAQKMVEWVRLKSQMYSDLPTISKL